MLDMRLGNSGDIPFIMNLVRDGITSGAFFYAEGNGLETVRSELQSVTQQYRDNIPVGGLSLCLCREVNAAAGGIFAVNRPQ
ncbi:Uncharacterised protein [Citrobacter koseri]|uniref:hypothetical protein n=1 Tax=Citrobacter koseri TaxID=545 RepID=UPI000E18C3D5|nr:hypothetical protein [Citrobacter koseri]SUY94288.1 Uncharacterised protein [Citrobacter koseri]